MNKTLKLLGTTALSSAILATQARAQNYVPSQLPQASTTQYGVTEIGTTTGTAADGGTLAATTSTANAALPQAASKNTPETGQLDFEGAGHLLYHGQGSFQWTSNDQDMIVEPGAFVYGFSQFADPFMNFGYAEALKDQEMDTSLVSDTMMSGARGARNVTQSSLLIGGRMGDASPLIAGLSHVNNQGTVATLAADGWPVGYGTTGGGTQGHWVNAVDSPQSGVTGDALATISGMAGMIGMEQDTAFPSTEMVNEHLGVDVQDQGGTAQTAYTNVTRHGLEMDAAIDVGGPSWGTIFAVGSTTNGWSGNPETTILKTFQREYAGGGPAFVARDGIDFRGMTFGGSAFTSADFAVNSAGSVSSKLMETGSGVQALSSSVTGATVVEGGLYTGVPSLTLDAPQLGGTQAVLSVATMGLWGATNINATGKGYKVGDVLTAGTGLKATNLAGTQPGTNSGPIVADVGLTGTSPTFKVTGVDSFGGITSLMVATPGAVTDTPTDHLLTLVYPSGSGTGTGAVAFVSWSIQTVYNSATPPQPVLGSYTLVPTGAVPAATGTGFKVGDTIAPTTDTLSSGGAEGQLKVAEVTPTGGILMLGLSRVSSGSVTQIGTESPRSITTSGSGTGSNLTFGYSIASVNATTPGSGYLADVQPVVTALQSVMPYQQSNWWNAKVRATLTPTPATLMLNPQGGNIALGASGSSTVTSTPSDIDVGGNVVLQGGRKSVVYNDGSGDTSYEFFAGGTDVANVYSGSTPIQSTMSRDNFIVGAGKIYLDTNKTEWVQEINGKVTIGTGTTNLFSVDGSGNVVAKGTVTQNGSP